MPISTLTNNTVHHFSKNSGHADKHMQEFIPEDIYVTTSAMKLAEICIELVFCFVVSIVGVVTNFLVIMVFKRQKFKDSVAVSMTAIAMWDFIKCLGCAMQRLSGPISLWDPAAAESWTNISLVAISYFTCFATYVSIVLAAYVAIERCLCVSIPFKVKWLITRKSSFIICSIISFVVFGWFAVVYTIYDIIWVYSFHYNRTIAIYVNSDFCLQHKQPLFLFYNLSGIILPVVSFVVIVASTVIIIYHLRKSSKFRSGSVQHSENKSENHIVSRDRQVIKMLLVVIGVYAICLTPRIAVYLAKYFVYDFYFLRRLHNLFMIIASIVMTFDVINSAINLFIFLTMSSSFRATFLETLPICNCVFHVKDKNFMVEQPGQIMKNA